MHKPRALGLDGWIKEAACLICGEKLTHDVLINSFAAAKEFYTSIIGDAKRADYHNFLDRAVVTFGLSPLYRHFKMYNLSRNIAVEDTKKSPQAILLALLNAPGGKDYNSFKFILLETIYQKMRFPGKPFERCSLFQPYSSIALNHNDDNVYNFISGVTQKLSELTPQASTSSKPIKPKFAHDGL